MPLLTLSYPRKLHGLSLKEAIIEALHIFIQDLHLAWRFFFHVDKCKSYLIQMQFTSERCSRKFEACIRST